MKEELCKLDWQPFFDGEFDRIRIKIYIANTTITLLGEEIPISLFITPEGSVSMRPGDNLLHDKELYNMINKKSIQ